MKKLYPVIIVILGIAAAALLARGVPRFDRLPALPVFPPARKTQVSDLVTKVSRHMILPSEAPIAATITDITKLKGQAFFEHAKNGDKVLIYEGLKKAILYDPQADRIVEVGHVNLTPDLSATGTAGTAPAK